MNIRLMDYILTEKERVNDKIIDAIEDFEVSYLDVEQEDKQLNEILKDLSGGSHNTSKTLMKNENRLIYNLIVNITYHNIERRERATLFNKPINYSFLSDRLNLLAFSIGINESNITDIEILVQRIIRISEKIDNFIDI